MGLVGEDEEETSETLRSSVGGEGSWWKILHSSSLVVSLLCFESDGGLEGGRLGFFLVQWRENKDWFLLGVD